LIDESNGFFTVPRFISLFCSMPETLYTLETLYAFTRSVFEKCNTAQAERATQALLAADLRGIDSHGIARLSGYIRLMEAGRIHPQAAPKIIHQTPSTATIDGDKGLGLTVAPFAMQTAIEKAKRAGTGWVSVKNSNHFGIAAFHAMQALEHDMIGIALTNASALVAPTFSTERLLGTNPICVAIPAGMQPPFVADMATTTAANGKLEILQRKGEATPTGWVQDKAGHASTDAHVLKKGGALLPLGSDRERGSHKGYALGAVVDIFSAVLSGANYGPWVPPFPAYVPMPEGQPGEGIGHFFGAMRIDAFRPADEFKQHMDNWINRFRSAKTIDGYDRVLIPGDPERETELARRRDGIPLHAAVVADLKELAQRFGLSL
jgi:L-2-hydroxycarboxylate dehydrogenase (NAD+)